MYFQREGIVISSRIFFGGGGGGGVLGGAPFAGVVGWVWVVVHCYGSLIVTMMRFPNTALYFGQILDPGEYHSGPWPRPLLLKWWI